MAKKKPKRKRGKRIDPFLTFYNARAFQVSASKLDQLPQRDFFLWPTIVCEAFGLELHLKCLHHVRRRYVTDSHDVKELFYDLSKADQRQIAKVLSEILRYHPNYRQARASGVLLDVDSILTRGRRMFVKARYWHERELPDADSRGHISTAGISCLSDAVQQVILKARPDWTEEKMKNFKLIQDQE